MNTFNFSSEPSFAELWDKCVRNLLYDVSDYTRDIEELFTSKNINKTSKILDISAGGGFPALDLSLKGYVIDCIDGSNDEVELFNKKSKENKLEVRCEKVLWKDIASLHRNNSYDFLFCRGNSFIYAAGGWNIEQDIDVTESKKVFEQTLVNFLALLKDGGYMYIDKFMDTEVSHYETVGEIKVGDESAEKLVFWTERFPEQNIRKASLIIEKINGDKIAVPNTTYDLKGLEFEEMLKGAGFSSVSQIKLPSEKHFQIWLCKK